MAFIQIGGGAKEEPVRRRRRRESNRWIRKASKEESTDELLREQQAQNPVIQAALLRYRTGIVDLKPEDIHTKSPEEEFRARIAVEAMKRIGENPEFIDDAAQAMIDSWYANDKTYRRFYRKGGRVDGEDGAGYMGPGGFPGYDPNDPDAIIDKYERMRERMGGKGGLDSLMNSDVLKEVVKILLPLMLGKGTQQIAAGPQMISVEVNGRLVEMTRDGYEVFKQQRRLLAAGHGPAPIAPGPPSANNGTPAAPGAPTSVAPAAAPAEGEKPVEEPQPEPATPEEGPIVIDNEELRLNVLTLVKGLIDDTDKRSPQEFAQLLIEQANDNDTNAIVAVNFLNTITYEQGMAYLQRLKHYEDFLPYIEKIEAKQEYMRAFIEHVKELAEEK